MPELAEEDERFWKNPKRRAIRNEIIDRMLKGQKFESACRSVGIDSSTGRRWKQRCVRFRQEIIMARYLRKATPRIDKLWAEGRYLVEEHERRKAGRKQLRGGP